jgi:hypothetical protein
LLVLGKINFSKSYWSIVIKQKWPKKAIANEDGANINTSLQLTVDSRARSISRWSLIYLWMGLRYSTLPKTRNAIPTYLTSHRIPTVCWLEVRIQKM